MWLIILNESCFLLISPPIFLWFIGMYRKMIVDRANLISFGNVRINRYVGRWLIAIPLALVPSFFSIQLLKISGKSVCSQLATSFIKINEPALINRLEGDCKKAATASINSSLIIFIWILLIRISYRYWPYLVSMVKEGELSDF